MNAEMGVRYSKTTAVYADDGFVRFINDDRRN